MRQKNFIDMNIEMTKCLFKASPRYFYVNFFNMLFNTLIFIVQVLFYQYIIDAVIYAKVTAKGISLNFFVYFLLAIVSYFVNFWVTNNFNEKEKVKISLFYKKWICNESVKKGVGLFANSQYKDKLYTAVYGDGDYLFRFSDRLFSFVSSIISCIFLIGVFSSLHPLFLVIVIFSAIKDMIIGGKKNQVNYSIFQNDLSFARNNIYIRNLFYKKQYTREMRLFSIGELFIEKFKMYKNTQWNSNRNSVHKNVGLGTVNELLDLLVKIINVLILVWFLTKNTITVGEFSLVLANFATAVGNLQGIFSFFLNVYDDARYIGDFFEVVEENNHTFLKVSHEEGKATAKFDDVSFSYDEESLVLKNINIELPLDRRVAIVGENGSGKSTFIKLLLGLYLPTQGKIEYFYPKQAVNNSLDLFSTMLQDYRIFPLSIAENIMVGDDENIAHRSKLYEAVKFSDLEEKLAKLPDGINTVLTNEFSENGICLSGGECQKVAISRAYFNENPILVLDEPSSNLDPVAENSLIQKINGLSDKRAVILIAHNVLYTQNVDLILFFKQGEIVEYGTPTELMQKQGYYYKMMSEQRKLMGVEGKN